MVRKCSVVIPDGPPAAPLRDVRRLRVKRSSSAFPGLHDSDHECVPSAITYFTCQLLYTVFFFGQKGIGTSSHNQKNKR